MNTQKKFLTGLALAGLMSASVVHADETVRKTTTYENTPSYTDPQTMAPTQQEQQSVVKETTDYKESSLRDETFGIAPQVGVLSYTNPNGAYSARAIAGLTGSFNLTPLVVAPENRNVYVGVTTGVLYSHNGSSSSNFFGTNSDINNTDNSNLLYIPADLKVGYTFGDAFRLSAHGGGNVIYRSVSGSVNLGAGSTGNDSLWKIYPNAGADMEWQVSKRLSILVRPDVTITPANDTFSATVGATFVNL